MVASNTPPAAGAAASTAARPAMILRSDRISELKTDGKGFHFSTQGSAVHPSATFFVPLAQANYNADYSMLLAAAINGMVVDIAGSRAADAAPGAALSVTSLALKWSTTSSAWASIPNPH